MKTRIEMGQIRKLPIGIQTFGKLREENFLYSLFFESSSLFWQKLAYFYF